MTRRDVIVGCLDQILEALPKVNPWTATLRPGVSRVGTVVRYYLLRLRVRRVRAALRRGRA